MPYLSSLRYEEEPRRQYLIHLFNSVQLKDIVKRNKVRDVDLLERIIRYIVSNIGTTFSATSPVKLFKSEYRTIAVETVLREFEAYRNIRDNFPKYVLSLDEINMSRDGIKHWNIRDFLIAENWD